MRAAVSARIPEEALLDFYGALARRLHRGRAFLWLAAGAALAVFVGTLFLSQGASAEAYMILSVSVLLWLLSLLVTTYAFVEPPPTIERDDRLLARARKRLRRLGYWAMALVMTVLTGGVLFLSVRAGGIAMRSLGG